MAFEFLQGDGRKESTSSTVEQIPFLKLKIIVPIELMLVNSHFPFVAENAFSGSTCWIYEM